jgi:hypothetical protein
MRFQIGQRHLGQIHEVGFGDALGFDFQIRKQAEQGGGSPISWQFVDFLKGEDFALQSQVIFVGHMIFLISWRQIK